jgi:hypothetical protein
MIHEAIIEIRSTDGCKSFSGMICFEDLQFPYELTFPDSLKASLKQALTLPERISDEAQLTLLGINGGPLLLENHEILGLGIGFYELLIDSASEHTRGTLKGDFQDIELMQKRLECELTPEGLIALKKIYDSRVENV